ncbi:MAG: diguanylate cyclase [Oscillospiraceae bacterium]|nr:diguanylate cyclase [Oscillospiraceae bacterium]
MAANLRKNSVLVVGNEKVDTADLAKMLSQEYMVYKAIKGQDVITVAKERLPDVILLELMPGFDGYETLSQLKCEEDTQHIPVIMLADQNNSESEEKSLALGASDFISKPCAGSIMRLRIKNQIKIVNQICLMSHLSTTDQLTGISNRRSYNMQVNKEWGRNMRDNKPLSLILLDIDRFKDFNDTYGHQKGDEVLRIIATTLKDSLRRSSDFAARWGGDEFVILLPGTDMKGALINAERIRENIEQTRIPVQSPCCVDVTVSIGVATLVPSQDVNQNELISQADKALYGAKEKGRNNVCEFNATVCSWPAYSDF